MTALWRQENPSGSRAPQSARTWNGNLMSTQSLKKTVEDVFSASAEETSTYLTSCWFNSTLQSPSLFSAHPSLSGWVQPPNMTSKDHTRPSGLQKGSLASMCPTSRTCTTLKSGNWQSQCRHLGQNLFQLPPLWSALQNTEHQNKKNKNSFFPHTITHINNQS